MIKELYLLAKMNWLRQIIKFGIVGATNIALDVVIYYFLTRHLHLYYLIAASISFVIVMTWSFNLNKRWTFKGQKVIKKVGVQYIEFLLINAFVMALNAGILFLLVDFGHIYDLISKIVASMVVGLVNFLFNKFVTFKDFVKIEK